MPGPRSLTSNRSDDLPLSLAGFEPRPWGHRGTANGYSATVRGLAFQIVGHERHHLGFLESKYQG